MDRYIGKFLDNRYELLEVIGTGGMAVVYKARCHRLNRLVAVKILKRELAQDAEFRRRFHDESQAVAMLSHPNIVAVYDVSHSDDLDYIVMELIDGITLKQYMQKKGAPLNWREALHYITQIMRGLSHAHSRGIIHRDIKPHNIMVLRDGSVKVADFGIARLTSANQSSLTQEALGSVHYISPEQARGSHIDARSDIYSAGVVLYEMTTGRLPFEGESPVSVAIQHINSIPLSPRDINPDIPEALQEITMKAMCPDPNERYLSADDMLTDLEEFRKNPNINFEYTKDDLTPGDEPTRPVPVGPIYAKDDHRREEPRREERRREAPPQPRDRAGRDDDMDYYDNRRGPVWPILLAVGAIVAFIAGIIWFLWSSFFSDIVNPETMSFPVPDLQGMTLTEIRQDSNITDQFEIVEGEFVPSEEFEAGQVVDQTPKKNEMVKANEGEKVTITVDISSGGSQMTIPKVENMEQRAAMELLRDSMGLVVSQELEANEEITKNYAIRTDLPEGTPVKRGDRVTLVISSGPDLKEIIVIPVTQMTLEEARKTLEGMELEVGSVNEEPSETVEAGKVLWQSIPGGTKVLAGTAIDLRVSSGPATPSDDPDVSTPPDVSPSPSTGVTPPPAVTDPPEPTPTQPASGSKAIPVNLPASAVDKSAVNVRIEVDGEVKHNSTVETGLFPISPRITGRGNQQVSIYVDDVLVDQYMVNFSE